MSKKYLNLEEAAAMLRMAPSELNKLRERGEIRAFADRGNWKFREEDVENLLRSRQADSNPELPLLPSDSSNEFVLGDDDDVLGDEPTIIRKGKNPSSSDSDIRLMLDDNDSSVSDVVLPLSDSDSDVKLVGDTKGRSKSGSDSDVKLVGESGVLSHDAASDSDVKLFGSTSDSDVKLIGDPNIGLKPESDSDVRLAGAPASPAKTPASKPPAMILPLDDDEGISLAPLDDEPVAKKPAKPAPAAPQPMGGSVLDDDALIPLAGDSGISLDRVSDSGISLDGGSNLNLGAGSHLNLGADSGLSLDLSSDSGITLAGDSAAPLAGGSGKGSGKQKKDDLHATAPMMNIPLLDDEDLTDTNLEIPLATGDSSSEYDSTSVINLSDDDDLDEIAATTISKKPGRGNTSVTQELDSSDDVFEAIDDSVDEFDDSVEVADDVMGEDDEVSADVFGADDEDFGDVEEGESIHEMATPAGRMMAPMEQDWGALAFTGVLLSSLVLLGTATVMYELVRNMWHADLSNANPVAGGLIDTIGGMF